MILSYRKRIRHVDSRNIMVNKLSNKTLQEKKSITCSDSFSPLIIYARVSIRFIPLTYVYISNSK